MPRNDTNLILPSRRDVLRWGATGVAAMTGITAIPGRRAWADALSPPLTTAASISGDFNQDGNYDCLDVDGLVEEIAGNTNNPSFDLTGDGLVDTLDLDAWLAEAGAVNLPGQNAYLYGDVDLDGHVDGSDFNTWNANKFTQVAAWCSGDFSADGVVDGGDFNLWNSNKFTSASASWVPEPVFTAIGLVACTWLGIGRTYRR